jgi:hypothetical protein
MKHRHLEHSDFGPAAIDDIIERGGRADWAELGQAVHDDPVVRTETQAIVEARSKSEPLNQRVAFWAHYVSTIT